MNAQKTSFLNQKQASGKLERTTSCSVSKRSPKLRLHKATGQAYVVLSGKYIFYSMQTVRSAVCITCPRASQRCFHPEAQCWDSFELLLRDKDVGFGRPDKGVATTA